jgi:hypothetical protein
MTVTVDSGAALIRKGLRLRSNKMDSGCSGVLDVYDYKFRLVDPRMTSRNLWIAEARAFEVNRPVPITH